MRRWFEDPDLEALSRDDLLGHLRPVACYRVDGLPRETVGGVELLRYLISGMRRNGVDVAISLRLFLRRPSDPRIVLTLPGGAGRVDDQRMLWLARKFDANHAVVDWVGRGQSGSHDGLAGTPDPLFMDGDSFRDCFQFHNVSAIWSALNWMFHVGYLPSDLVGGSWGGVYCFLIAALDDRVKRIFSTFGCGGFVLPGIEKRTYWDLAIEHIGADRFRAWCAAFDPILRLADVNAEVYFETATNDKFFSVDMAMETWRRVKRPNFLSLAYNQDHSMAAYGLQPYRLQRLEDDDPVFAQGRAATRTSLTWEVKSDSVMCWPLSADERSRARLVVSEQLAANGNMSREWRVVEPARSLAGGALFDIAPTHLDADMLYYLDQEIVAAGVSFRAATPIVGGKPRDRGVDRLVAPSPQHSLLDSRTDDLTSAPLGDKAFPRVVARDRGWSVSFSGERFLRVARFGIKPWLLPPRWSFIEVELAEALDKDSERLELILSRSYNRREEQSLGQPFECAELQSQGQICRYRFAREAFSPVRALAPRFGLEVVSEGEDVSDAFDAVSIVDRVGGTSVHLWLLSIRVR